MGVPHSKRCDHNEEIISEKSLKVVKEMILFLKGQAREEGLFRRGGRRDLRLRIFDALKKGEKCQFENSALECAAALQLFLSQMKSPVMPQRVQQLIIADNPGVTAHEVARDALGLIRQDVGGRHGELLADLLGLIKHLTSAAPPSERSELQGPTLPLTLLPTFFNLTPEDLLKWRQIATRFSELIAEAPTHLRWNDSNLTINQEPSRQNTQRLTRIRDFSLLYPLMRLAENRNAYQVGEIARVFTNPLPRPPVSRLHPVISQPTRI